MDGVTTPHPYALLIPQSDTEQLMGEFVTSLGVKIERNIELTGLYRFCQIASLRRCVILMVP